jgi:hypothetical protein
LNIGGISHNDLENTYAKIDNDMAEIYNEISEYTSFGDTLKLEGFIKFKFFISNLFWRIPANDKLANILLGLMKPSDLPFTVTGIDKEVEEQMKQYLLKDISCQKMLRCIDLPTFTFSYIDEPTFIDKWEFLYIPENKKWNKRLTCDNPIIFKDYKNLFLLNDNILFPLTGNKTLFCIDKLDRSKKPTSDDSMFFDIAVFSNATRYVCGADKDYLNEIAEKYMEIKKLSGDQVHQMLLEYTFSLFGRK